MPSMHARGKAVVVYDLRRREAETRSLELVG